MSRLLIDSPVAFALAAVLAACGPGRNSPATQTANKVFDAAKSDPKAVAIADQVLAAVGGEAAWAKAKQIQWTQSIIIDGVLKDVAVHAWDRWNGRHRLEHLEPSGQWDVTMHEMFGDVSFAYFQSAHGRGKAVQSEKLKLVAEAQRRFDSDAYRLFLPFKLKDPGVHLAFSAELPEEGSPQGSPMKYDEIKITFEPGIGPAPGDTWYLIVDKQTHLPTIIEHVATGKPDTERAGIKLSDWQESGGLRFAGKQTTLGYTKADAPKVPVTFPAAWAKDVPFKSFMAPKPGEIVLILGIKVSDSVDDELYVRSIGG